MREKIFYLSLLSLAAALVYFPILGNGFLYFWDDQWVVMNRYTEGGFNLWNLWAILSEFYHGQYAPLNELLYLSLYTPFGYNPFFFHLASLLLHVANTILVFLCISKLLDCQSRITLPDIKLIAFITALIFTVHPFNVESVAWMSASKILVYAFFYLLATYCFLLYLQKSKIQYLLLTALLFICSFGGKEQAVTFPVWMLLIYWWKGYDLKNKKVWITVTPFLVLSLLFGFITMFSQLQGGGGVLSNKDSYALWQRVVYASYSYAEYLIKSFFPFKLSYLYPFPSVEGDPIPSWLLAYPLLLVMALVSLGKQILANKLLLFSLLFITIHLAVALHIIPLSRFAVVADRYAYISSIGVALIISYTMVYFRHKLQGAKRFIPIYVIALYIGYLGIYAHTRTYVWYDTDTLKKEIREILKERDDYKEEKEEKRHTGMDTKNGRINVIYHKRKTIDAALNVLP